MVTGDVTIATVSNGCGGRDFSAEPGKSPESVRKDLGQFTTSSLDDLMRYMRQKATDGRRDSKHIGIMFVTTPLTPIDFRKAEREMKRARFQNTAIFVIGIGDEVDAEQLRQLTTLGGVYLHAYDLSALQEVSKSLLYYLCLYGVDK